MLVWNFNGQGPGGIQGQVYTATLGTAVAFSAGVAVAYAGLALANPATVAGKVPVKLVPLRINLSPTAAVSGTVAWGILKLTGQGTASNGGLSAFSGAIFAPGVAGTATGVAIVGGTFSVINGTAAGTGSNTLYWQTMIGGVNCGTGAGSLPVDLQGYESALPGETLAIGCTVSGVTAQASITWAEIPLNSGA